MSEPINRRDWMVQCTAAGAAGALPALMSEAVADDAWPANPYKNYFGDLHNHNAVGYAKGSLERSFDIARNHLDFYAFTPHAYWPDVGEYHNHIEKKWHDGFQVAKRRWPEVVAAARKYDQAHKFVAILGYERHHSAEGDYHILFPDLKGDYELIDDLGKLQAFARRRGCIMVPHHPANRLGHRGIDISKLAPRVSPVLEVFSEWGCAEHDRAPFPYKRHSLGGRWTKNTLQYYLQQGHRLGVIASTDDHLGYPGAYREGLAVVKAEELTRPAIFDALRHRRTYAVTGDRIGLDFRLNGAIMGSEIPYSQKRTIHVGVDGWDVIDRIEVVKNGQVIYRQFPVDRVPNEQSWTKPMLVRFEYGWGPWAALGWNRTADWNFAIELQGGRILDVQPCFASTPLEEERRDRIVEHDERMVRVESYTSLNQRIDDFSQKAVVLRIEGDPDTRVAISCTQPTRCSLTQSLAQLNDSNEKLFTREFPWESALLHRVVFNDNSQSGFRLEDEGDGRQTDWYYVRVFQSNGQMAWSSPIWVERAG